MKEDNDDEPKICIDQKQPIPQQTSQTKPISFKTIQLYENEDDENTQNSKFKNSLNVTEKTNNNSFLNFSSEKDSKENMKIYNSKITNIEKISKILNNKQLDDSSYESLPDEEIPIEQFTKNLDEENNNNNETNNINNPIIKKIENNEKNEKNSDYNEDDENNTNQKKVDILQEYLSKNDFQNKELKIFEKENDNLSLCSNKEKNDGDSVGTPFFGLDSPKFSENDENDEIIKKIEPIKINTDIEGNFVEKLIEELEEVEKENWGNFRGGSRKKTIVGGRFSNNNRIEDELEAFAYPYKDNSLCCIW